MEFELTDSLTNVLPMYSKQHFKDAKVEGNKVILTFGPNANTALQGFISLGVITNNDTNETIDGIVKTKFKDEEVHSKISILPQATGVPGEETRTIVKFTERSNADRTYQQISGDTGLIMSGCEEIEFMIEVNPKKGNLKDVVVTDFLPYETELIQDSINFEIYKNGFYDPISKDNLTIFKDARHFEIRFGDINDGYRIRYKARVKDTSHRFINSAKVKYNEDDKDKTEISEFYLKPFTDAGGINVSKYVDKDVISNGLNDQLVTYTIAFQSDNVFDKGSIDLDDKLDPRIKFVDAISSPEFEVNYDSKTHTVKIQNSNGEIPAYQRREVKIITDFSQVKPGEEIINTIGTNTTVTKKKICI